ncbi:hypothetical protein [Frigidibacter sp. MR17.24]|uniref:hypothetical protein n=1 Tax=Frigidibacter sp. MR17.24 TaxID=3127345 RepID=UPI00301314C8
MFRPIRPARARARIGLAAAAATLSTAALSTAGWSEEYQYGYTAANGYGAGAPRSAAPGYSAPAYATAPRAPSYSDGAPPVSRGYGGVQSPSGRGYTVSGRLEYETLVNRDHSTGFAYGDVTFGFMSPSGPFGFELGFEGYQAGEGDIAPYGAVKFDTGAGVVSAGVPRSSMDTFLDIPAIGGSQREDLAVGALTRGTVGTSYLSGADTPWGLRYDGSFGQAALSGSVHQFEGDGTVVDGTIHVQTGMFTLSAGAENVDRTEGRSGVNIVTGAKVATGIWEGGLYYSDVQRPDKMTGWTGYGRWAPGGPVAVTGTLISKRESGETDTLYGLSGEYTFWEGAYLQGGFFDGEDTKATYDISMGWKF